MTWTFEIDSDWQGIYDEAYVERWRNMVENAADAQVFFHPSLVLAWLDTYRPLRQLTPCFIRGRNDAGEEVFLPLVVWKRNWKNFRQRLLIPAGYSDFDYHDPVFSTAVGEESRRLFWSELFQELKRCCRFDTWLLDGMHEKIIPDFFRIISTEKCYFIPLPEKSYADYLADLPAGLVKKNRRRTRNAEKIGEVELRIFSGEELAAAAETLPEMLELHARRWPNAYKAPGFHANLLARGIAAGTVLFSRLSVGEEPICWRLSLVFRSTLYLYMQTVKESYREYSPGTMLFFRLLEWAFSRGIHTFDLLRGSESYKNDWTECYEVIYHLEYRSGGLGSGIRNFLVGMKRMAGR